MTKPSIPCNARRALWEAAQSVIPSMVYPVPATTFDNACTVIL
ncbi:hypothetical protein AA15237_2705 [Komagataeibacter xylinus NBRC 15237]|nr:hypothetical protein AA15237_2705 [Komagataeibacter xylinus NBRC 15237]